MPATCPLSIVLPCRNPGSRLREALDSIWCQRGVDLELIVVDGASTDGAHEWLESQRERLATLISEPDGGIYDAMNKGIAAAHGEWVFFMGADDRLVGENVLSEVLNWARKTDAGVMAGEAAYDDGRIYRLRSNVNPLARNFVHHQAAFYRRSLFEENGTFDTSLIIAADYEFNLRLWKNRVRFKPIPLRIAACGTRGTSDGGAWRVYGEEIKVRHQYYRPWRCWFWDALSIVRYLRKRLVLATRRRG